MINTLATDNTLTNLTSPMRQIDAKVELSKGSSTFYKDGYSITIDNPKATNICVEYDTTEEVTLYRYGKNILDYTLAEDRKGNPLTIIEDGFLWDSNISYYFFVPCFIPAGVGFTASWKDDYEENPDTISGLEVCFEDGTLAALTHDCNRYWHIPKKNITKIGLRKTNASTTETTPIKITHFQVELVEVLDDLSLYTIVSENDNNRIMKGCMSTPYEPYIAPEIITVSEGVVITDITPLPYMSFYCYSEYNLGVAYMALSYQEPAQTFTNEDYIQTLTIDRVGENGKFFGFGISQKLKLNLLDKNGDIEINYEYPYRVSFKADVEYINNFADFFVSKDETKRDEAAKTIELVAYDALAAAAAHTTAEVISTTGVSSVSPRVIAEVAAEVLGLSLDLSYVENAFDVWEYTYTTLNLNGTESLRSLLDAIAEATLTIYYVSGDKLVFRRLDKDAGAEVDISKNEYFTLTLGSQIVINGICHATELGDNIEVRYSEGGITQYIRNNPFFELEDELYTQLEELHSIIEDTSMYQYSTTWRGNFLLNIGDAIKFNDNYTFLLNDTINYNGGYRQTSSWSYEDNKQETATNPSTLGEVLNQTKARVDKVNKRIELVASESTANTNKITSLEITTENISSSVSTLETKTNNDKVELETQITQTKSDISLVASEAETNKSDIAAIKINTESISSSVSALETKTDEAVEGIEKKVTELETQITQTADNVKIEIKEEILAAGASSVTTSTGFTFNEEGLTVEKTNSEMKTTISEDGMKVYKNNTEVLTADNEGVKAIDLHATTYLIVGSNSRFENYGSNRTGCFWIGG